MPNIQCFITFKLMVIILDVKSEIGAHVRSNPSCLIFFQVYVVGAVVLKIEAMSSDPDILSRNQTSEQVCKQARK